MLSSVVIAALAQLFIGLSLVFDKILLGKRTLGDPVLYVFWLGVVGLAGVALVPFGFAIPPLATVLLALATGGTFIAGLLFQYLALTRGEASQTLAIVGGFTPVAAAIAGRFLLKGEVNVAYTIAFGILVASGFLLFFSDIPRFKHLSITTLLSSMLLGFTTILEKLVFIQTPFATGFGLIKIGGLLTVLSFLLIPSWRKKITSASRETPTRHRFAYFGNRLLAGTGSAFILYAIALGNPAIVEAIGGFRYVVIFLAVVGITAFRPQWLKETFSGWSLALKIIATILIALALGGLGLQEYYQMKPLPAPNAITWGVTFSQKMSERLGLDWRENYRAILGDLRPTKIRLIAYWDLVEPNQNEYDFRDLDWQIDMTEKAAVPFILTLGQKVPRWPECHYPSWIQGKEKTARDKELLKYLRTVAERYKNRPMLEYWQVENEAFLHFGECPSPDGNLLDQEIALVRSIDERHPILLTDGGEFGDWYRSAKRGDAFGTSLYRKVYNKLFGYITYPLTPEFYPLKKSATQFLAGKPKEKFIVVELGLEPWAQQQIPELSPDQQRNFFSVSDFRKTTEYAIRARFETYYLWGAEWWYWMLTHEHDPSFWNSAKKVFESARR